MPPSLKGTTRVSPQQKSQIEGSDVPGRASNHVLPGRPLVIAWTYCAVISCSLLVLLFATSSRPTSTQKLAQAAVFLFLFVSALPLLTLGLPQRVQRLTLLTYAAGLVLATPAITQYYFNYEWFIGDLLLVSVPLLIGIGLYAASLYKPRILIHALRAILACLFTAAIISRFFPDPLDSFRFVPPAPLLMAALWTYSFALKGVNRLIMAIGLTMVAALTLQSQWRSSALVFAFIGIGAAFYFLRGRARSVIVAATTAAICALMFFGFSLPGLSSFSGDSRLIQTFENGGLAQDSSTTFRFVEAKAVLATATAEWSPLNLPFGSGHGGTYDFSKLDRMPGSKNFGDRNGEDGRVHNIHLGPALLLYRYGVAGALFGLVATLTAVRRAIQAGREQEPEIFIVAVGMVGCILIGVANNVSTQIHFSLTAALFVALVVSRSAPRRLADARSAT